MSYINKRPLENPILKEAQDIMQLAQLTRLVKQEYYKTHKKSQSFKRLGIVCTGIAVPLVMTGGIAVPFLVAALAGTVLGNAISLYQSAKEKELKENYNAIKKQISDRMNVIGKSGDQAALLKYLELQQAKSKKFEAEKNGVKVGFNPAILKEKTSQLHKQYMESIQKQPTEEPRVRKKPVYKPEIPIDKPVEEKKSN